MANFDNDGVYGVCPCGFSGKLEDGLCSHCLMAAEAGDGLTEEQLEEIDELSRDSILEQQELEDFEGLEPDYYPEGEDSYLDAMYEDRYEQYDFFDGYDE